MHIASRSAQTDENYRDLSRRSEHMVGTSGIPVHETRPAGFVGHWPGGTDHPSVASQVESAGQADGLVGVLPGRHRRVAG